MVKALSTINVVTLYGGVILGFTAFPYTKQGREECYKLFDKLCLKNDPDWITLPKEARRKIAVSDIHTFGDWDCIIMNSNI
jgi:hypothetical protein